MLVLALLFAIAVLIVIVLTAYLILRPMLFGAIYFPTMPDAVEIIREFAAAAPGTVIADLGSGDGRIVMAFARDGAEAHGYEVDPLLVIASRRAITDAGLTGKAFIHRQSFWKADLSRYDTVVVYGFPHIMPQLAKKLARELKPGAKIISNVFRFPDLTEVRTKNKVRLYTVPPNV